jgi:hypothetical protein
LEFNVRTHTNDSTLTQSENWSMEIRNWYRGRFDMLVFSTRARMQESWVFIVWGGMQKLGLP